MKAQISVEELTNLLESLIRRIVREELGAFVAEYPEKFSLSSDSPLLDDLEDILHRQAQGKLKFHSQLEVWGE